MGDAPLTARQMTMLRMSVRGGYVTTDQANTATLAALGYVTVRPVDGYPGGHGRELTATARGLKLLAAWQGTQHTGGGDAA